VVVIGRGGDCEEETKGRSPVGSRSDELKGGVMFSFQEASVLLLTPIHEWHFQTDSQAHQSGHYTLPLAMPAMTAIANTRTTRLQKV
jgi:hypothetical protein